MRNLNRPGAVQPTAGAAFSNRPPFMLTAAVWLLVILMIVPKDFVSLFQVPVEGAEPSSAGAALNSILWLVLLIAGPLFIVRRMPLAKQVIKQLNIFFIFFFVMVLLSCLWSADTPITFDRFRRLTIMVCCSLAFVLVGWNPRRFQSALRPVITVLLAGSIIYGMLFPELAIHQSDSPELAGAWHGLTFQKNIFGALATYGVILWFHGWLSRETSLVSSLVGGGISLLCVLLSHSSTSLLTTAFSIFLLLLILKSPVSLRRYTPYFIAAFVLLVVLYALAALGLVPALKSLLDPISAATGKDAGSATGRAPIWDLVKLEIARHPWLGIGYGAYWTGPIPGTASYIFVTAIYFYAGSSHNGYLEVTNELGYVGLTLLICYALLYVKHSLVLWKTHRTQAALYLALVFQQGLENLSEAEWFQVVAFNFVIMTLATFSLARGLLDQKMTMTAPAAASPPVANAGLAAARGAPRGRLRRR